MRGRDPLVAVRIPPMMLRLLDEARLRELVGRGVSAQVSTRSGFIRLALSEKLGCDDRGGRPAS